MRQGWANAALGDVTLPMQTCDPRKSPDKSFRYVDVSSVSNRTFEISDAVELLGKDAPSRARRKVEEGDIIFATIRPTLRRIAMVPKWLHGEICSTGFFVFRPRAGIDGRFLYYHLFTKSFSDAVEALQSGASYPAVNDGQVRKQPIAFPPLPEQRRIVAILDEAFQGIDRAVANTEKNLANARELFESQLNAIFSANDEQASKLNNAIVAQDDVVREGWETSTLGDVTLPMQTCDPRKSPDKSFRYVDVSSVSNRTFEVSEAAELLGKDAPSRARRKVEEGDIIFATIRPTLRRIAMVPKWLHGEICSTGFFVFRPRAGIDGRFLYYHLFTKSFSDAVEALQSGASYPAVNDGQVRKQPIAFPPLPEQKRIVAILDELKANSTGLVCAARRKLDLLAGLKQSILHKAFAGELTADEPVLAEAGA